MTDFMTSDFDKQLQAAREQQAASKDEKNAREVASIIQKTSSYPQITDMPDEILNAFLYASSEINKINAAKQQLAVNIPIVIENVISYLLHMVTSKATAQDTFSLEPLGVDEPISCDKNFVPVRLDNDQLLLSEYVNRSSREAVNGTIPRFLTYIDNGEWIIVDMKGLEKMCGSYGIVLQESEDNKDPSDNKIVITFSTTYNTMIEKMGLAMKIAMSKQASATAQDESNTTIEQNTEYTGGSMTP